MCFIFSFSISPHAVPAVWAFIKEIDIVSDIRLTSPPPLDFSTLGWHLQAYKLVSRYSYFSLYIGRGSITNIQAALSSSSVQSNPPTFTLRGTSSEGPPTTYTWTRNGAVITDGGPYSISIAVNGDSETGIS